MQMAEKPNSHDTNTLNSLLLDLKESAFTSFAIIDLENIKKNYQILAQKASHSIIAAAVKADAYGLGDLEVTEVLYEEGARHFFVATYEEGVTLKKYFKDSNIYVLYGPQEGNCAGFKKHNLIPVLNSLDQVRLWIDETTKSRKDYPAFLHVDTGMNRLGLTQEEFKIFDNKKIMYSFSLQGIMSHLACAEDPKNPLNQIQLDRFLNIKNKIPEIAASFANSAGIFLDPKYHFDMVRPGIALYGGNPTPNLPNPMNNILQLYAKILQIKKINKGDSVGYGATFVAPHAMTIGIISYGYADGLLRSASNRGEVYYKGQYLKILGRVSMDLMAVDLTPILSLEPEIDDLVELIGQHLSLDKVADFMGTIHHEVLTSLRDRMYRFYMK